MPRLNALLSCILQLNGLFVVLSLGIWLWLCLLSLGIDTGLLKLE